MTKPIRILHIVTYMGHGGLESMLMNYYRNIDRNVVQFDFLTHRKQRAAYDDEIERMGGRIFRLNRLNPFSKEYKKSLDLFFKEHSEYKIVHSHLDCMSAIPLKVALDNHVPVRIAHSHSSSQTKDIKYVMKLCYKRKIEKYATKLFACSEEAGTWMFGNAKFEILANAIDAQKFAYDEEKRKIVRNQLGIENELVLGHVGRFSYPKNHTFLVEIFNEVHKINPNTRLLLVGGRNLIDRIKEKVANMGLSNDVIFTGERSDVADLMQAMDIFVFPSLYEGLPLTIVEAQASGLTCFISDKVPIECKKTELVQQIELDKGSRGWAKKILDTNISRKDMYEEICNAKYDIKASAKELMDYYCKMEIEQVRKGKKYD